MPDQGRSGPGPDADPRAQSESGEQPAAPGPLDGCARRSRSPARRGASMPTSPIGSSRLIIDGIILAIIGVSSVERWSSAAIVGPVYDVNFQPRSGLQTSRSTTSVH